MVSQSKKNLAPTTNLGTFKGGSLPNVSEQNKRLQSSNVQIVDATNSTNKKVQINQFYLSEETVCLEYSNWAIQNIIHKFILVNKVIQGVSYRAIGSAF